MAISQEEQKYLKFLNNLYTEGAKHREMWSREWNRAIDIVKGKVWPEKRPSYKVNAAMNFLAQTIEKKAALLTDQRPTISVVSRRKGLDGVCEILQKTIEGILEEKMFEQKLLELTMLDQHFGIGFTNTCFDKTLDYGKGDIDIVIIDPRCCVFDAFVTRAYNLGHGEYFALETVRPTELLKDMYPKRADDIKSDFGTEQQVKEDSLLSKIRQVFRGQTDMPGTRMSSVIPRSIIREFWLRDRVTKEDGELKYPTWRYSKVVGGCVAVDDPNPYWDGNLPYDAMDWIFNVDSAYGQNEVSMLEMPQIMFNKVLATVIENAILTGNNIWQGDRDALTDMEWKRLSNEPGAHVKVRPGRKLERVPAPPMPNYITNVLTMLVGGIEKLSGITDVMEGRKPGQVTSGAAIENLQMAAQTSIRLKARQLEAVIQRIGQKLISRIFEYYTNDRIFNLVGDGAHYNQFVYERAKIEEAVQKAGLKISTAFRDFQFKVLPGSSLAMTKWQKGLIAIQLYQLAAIDREALLDAIEFPNREEILTRTIEKQQSGVEPMGGMRKAQKMNKAVLRGGHRETGVQLPQMGGR